MLIYFYIYLFDFEEPSEMYIENKHFKYVLADVCKFIYIFWMKTCFLFSKVIIYVSVGKLIIADPHLSVYWLNNFKLDSHSMYVILRNMN